EAYQGVVDLNDFGPVIYKVEGEDLYLIATSEHPLIAMHMDEILDGGSLPIKYCGFSPNFRWRRGRTERTPRGYSGLTSSTRSSRSCSPGQRRAGASTRSSSRTRRRS